MTVRRATEGDRQAIAALIVNGFEKEFSALTRDLDRMAAALRGGIRVERFFVAEGEDGLVGAAACTDCTGRAVYPRRPDLCKHLGLLKGTFSYCALKGEFTRALGYEPHIGYIEFVTVAAAARGRGAAKRLLAGIVEQSGYRAFILDVTDVNTYAIQAYTTFGFVETHREPAKHPKLHGYNEKIYMRYAPPQGE